MGNAESTTAMASVNGTSIRAISGFRKLLGPKASAVKVNSLFTPVFDKAFAILTQFDMYSFHDIELMAEHPFLKEDKRANFQWD